MQKSENYFCIGCRTLRNFLEQKLIWPLLRWVVCMSLIGTWSIEKGFLNLLKSNRILIVITFFRLIFRLMLNQSEKCNYFSDVYVYIYKENTIKNNMVVLFFIYIKNIYIYKYVYICSDMYLNTSKYLHV